nr:MAG TPA: hypothetical protein [Crassvirales sp.]
MYTFLFEKVMNLRNKRHIFKFTLLTSVSTHLALTSEI